MGKVLRIQLLGKFHLVYDGKPIGSIDSPRLQSLLAYLLIHRDAPVSRQRLSYLFWTDSSESQARTNLRNLLYHLKEGLPDADQLLEINPKTLWWRPAIPIDLDLEEFENHLNQAAQAQASGQDQEYQHALTEAVGLYQGDLLPSCYEDWILPERERLSQSYIRALEELIDLSRENKDYNQAIHSCQALLRQDPLHEATYRELMSLFDANGEKAQAVRVYHQCVDSLEKELGLEPGIKTRQLYQTLMDRSADEAEPARVTEKGARLVGRDQAWKTLLDDWRDPDKKSRMVLIQGEPGIGKTYLAEEFTRWVRRQGIKTLQTRSYPLAGELAYTQVADLLRNEAICPKLPSLEEAWLIELTRLLPELRQTHPELPDPEPLEESWQRQRLFESAARGITLGEQRLLILIDDLQWCDRETLAWLGFLLKFKADARILILATVRLEEVPAESQLHLLLAELEREGRITRIQLEPLDQDYTAALARAVWGAELEPGTAAQLFHETEGNPLFVVEVVRSGFLAQGPGGTRTLPPKIQAVIETRLNALSSNARHLASIGAVTGRNFDYPLLTKAAEINEDQAIRGLDELWGRRVIRDESGEGYNFSHDKFREVLYQGLSPPRRTLLHKKVAQAIEELHQAQLGEVASQLAHHYQIVGEKEKAVQYLIQAGDQARAIFARENAVAHYQDAIAYRDHPPDQLSISLYQKWGNNLLELACYEQAQEAFQRMRDAAVEVGDCELEAQAWLALGKVLDRQGDHTQALASAEKALEVAAENRCSLERTEAVLLIGQSYHRLGQAEQAEEHIIQALELSVIGREAFTTGRCLSLLGLIKDDLGDYQMAREYKTQALEIFENLEGRQAREWVGTISNNLANTANLRGEYQEAVELYGKALDLFRRTKNQDMIIMCLVNLSAAQVGLEKYQEAESDLREVLELTETSGWLGLSLTYYFLAEALLGQGRIEESLKAGSKALEQSRESGAQQALGAAWKVLGKGASQLGKAIQIEGQEYPALACFEESERIFRGVNAEAERAHTLQAWGEHELAHGSQRKGKKLLEEAREIFARLGINWKELKIEN